MLSAEYLALQSRLVQQLAAVKQKELDYVLGRYQAIALQAALVSSCAMSTLVSISPDQPGEVPVAVTWLFFIVSMVCCFSCTYVTVCCLYIGNWAPGLALRGPTGSLNHAFDVVMHERKQLNFWFTLSLVTFVVQTVLSVWVLSHSLEVTGYTIVCTLMGLAALAISGKDLLRMKKRFFREGANLKPVPLSQRPGAKPAALISLGGVFGFVGWLLALVALNYRHWYGDARVPPPPSMPPPQPPHPPLPPAPPLSPPPPENQRHGWWPSIWQALVLYGLGDAQDHAAAVFTFLVVVSGLFIGLVSFTAAAVVLDNVAPIRILGPSLCASYAFLVLCSLFYFLYRIDTEYNTVGPDPANPQPDAHMIGAVLMFTAAAIVSGAALVVRVTAVPPPATPPANAVPHAAPAQGGEGSLAADERPSSSLLAADAAALPLARDAGQLGTMASSVSNFASQLKRSSIAAAGGGAKAVAKPSAPVPGARSPSGGGGGSKPRRGSVMLDNPLANLVGVNQDLSLAQPGWSSGSPDAALSSADALEELERSGVLYKRVGTDGGSQESSVLGLLKKRASIVSVQAAITSAWQPRYFVLREGTLKYWRAVEDHDQGKPPSAEIDLQGYEVLIDAEDAFWAFELRPTIDDGRRRPWYFRAETEDDRLEWAKRLVAQSFASSTYSSRRYSSAHSK